MDSPKFFDHARVARAKFMLTEIKYSSPDGRMLVFTPQYDPQAVPEDIAFCKYTPSGKFEMLCTNPAVRAQMELGKQYYIDLSTLVESA